MIRSFKHYTLLCILVSVSLMEACHNETSKTGADKALELRKQIDTVEAPVLSPEESMKRIQLEKGFSIQLVASEPLVHTPVAMRFDSRGRIWVVEMEGYMPDTVGTGENRPVGKIVILEDTTHDGVMDTRKVFMDSLVMPRALCLFDDGILVAEPPNLWFVENDQDKAGRKYLVDDHYAVGGNVEHQPNGLLRGLDNWIYSAKSAMRYRRVGKDKWVKEQNHFRGQWGISQDDYGRLYYNNNSANLLGDYFSPGLGALNPHQQDDVNGYNENIVPDNRTYPIRPTPGVNRGYQQGILDDSLRLVKFTAACGPILFRSNAFGPSYYNNAFVAEPAGNLIKRNILFFKGNKTTGEQAYQHREFLASTDERFRPVDLNVGPEGDLYVVDMYRGLIQHRTYLTPYLKGEIKMRGLQQPLNCGRIYRIVRLDNEPAAPVFSTSPDSLLSYLGSSNSWLRQTANNYIVDKHMTSLVPGLKKMMQGNGNSIISRINALWVLEGLGQLNNQELAALLPDTSAAIRQQVLTAAAAIMKNTGDAGFWINQCKPLANSTDTLLAPYTAFLAAAAAQYSFNAARPLLLNIAIAYRHNRYVADAVISGLKDKEQDFLAAFKTAEKDTVCAFVKHLKRVIVNTTKQKEAALADKKTDKKLARGKALFQSTCMGCHGADGNGVKSLGAPLNGSNWVQGDKSKLLSIVLYGLTGPIKVGDKLFAPPEVGTEMPGIAGNDELSDDDIAQILSYIRNTWGNHASLISEKDVKAARRKFADREEPFTMKELLQK